MGSAKGRNNPQKKGKVVVVVGLARLQVAPWDSDSLMLPACTLFPSFTSSPFSTPSIPLSSSLPLGPWGNYKGTPLRLAEEKRGEPFSLCVSEGRGGRKRFIGGKKGKGGKVVRRFFATPFSSFFLAHPRSHLRRPSVCLDV